MYCPYCKRETRDDSPVCSYCGRALPVPPRPAARQAPEEARFYAGRSGPTPGDPVYSGSSSPAVSRKAEAARESTGRQRLWGPLFAAIAVLLFAFVLVVFLASRGRIEASRVPLIGKRLEVLLDENNEAEEEKAVPEEKTVTPAPTVDVPRRSVWNSETRMAVVDDTVGVWADTADMPFSGAAERIGACTPYTAVVLTVEDLGTDTARDFLLDRCMTHYGVRADRDNAVLLLINFGSSEYWIELCGAAEAAMDKAAMGDVLLKYLAAGDYETGVCKMLAEGKKAVPDSVPLAELTPIAASDGTPGFRYYTSGHDNQDTWYSESIGGYAADTTNWCEYRIGSAYRSISGTVYMNYEFRNKTANYCKLTIYGDERLLFTSSVITKGVAPQPFQVDITGVNVLRVCIYGNDYVRLSGCALIP